MALSIQPPVTTATGHFWKNHFLLLYHTVLNDTPCTYTIYIAFTRHTISSCIGDFDRLYTSFEVTHTHTCIAVDRRLVHCKSALPVLHVSEI